MSKSRETIKLITEHRSIRRFKDDAVDESLIQQIVEAGQAASTSSFTQLTSVIRVTDQSLRATLATLSGEQAYVEQAPEFFVFCADLKRSLEVANGVSAGETLDETDFAWAEQLITSIIDVALFAQNCAIAAESFELGICYIGGIRNNIDEVSKALRLPRLVIPLFGMCIGYPDQQPAIRPRLPASLIFFENAYPSDSGVLSGERAAQLCAYDETVRNYYLVRSKGRLEQSWSEQIAKQAAIQTRPHVLEYLRSQGFILK